MGDFSSKSVACHNVLPETWSSQCKSKPDWNISKFKAWYCVIADVQKTLYSEPLNLYYPVVQLDIVRLMLILQCIIGVQSQSIYFNNSFTQVKIPNGYLVFIELLSYFKSDGGQCDAVLRLNKIIYGQDKSAHLWYQHF